MNISRIYFLGKQKMNPLGTLLMGKTGVLLSGIGQEVTNCKLRRILPVTGQ
jgi:hypothetical protein